MCKTLRSSRIRGGAPLGYKLLHRPIVPSHRCSCPSLHHSCLFWPALLCASVFCYFVWSTTLAMRFSLLPAAVGALLLPASMAQFVGGPDGNTTTAPAASPDKDGKYWISSNHIKAAFIPYGASISDLIIQDQYGIPRDIVAGFDNASYYSIDRQHPHFGGVPGRYANRIKNGTFEIDGETYKVDLNDNNGLNTLHGGSDGWDYRNFTVVSHTNNSITFSFTDPDGKEGFPGEVVALITYTIVDWNWEIKMIATATTKKTPIMLSSHTYWNLDGFANNETSTALNHTLHMPYNGQRVAVDNILIPTGEILPNPKGSVNDFWSAPKQIGADFSKPELENNCGLNCTGYDNCWIVNRDDLGPYNWRTEGYIARLQSAWSGIQVDVYSDQDAFQMYSCSQQNGSVALKKSQGLFDNADHPRIIPKYGCVVLEVQDWIDGINNPAWGRGKKQIFEPGGDPYVLQASYRFSINSTSSDV
ncbi:Putative aldose 1-/Glucose-6-phosphate 1-epimerase, galactose mutarotase-like domain superfamily [Colletotrichum destructivum]|uniref:Aldose 1-/Glucose-6-phosphate 1-epimerase, galactose mutarotase-like domain superfamily n=1 Tax=Colletotrichum destructivum TaxID=34406 RepID=A0AAX4IF20_9PEZI|nr:Putative aldose 1-/Glucose-6-phosphate 1-epimerase, galactose mutarotase-like domain superfamily [Colletotrichum destructivum]